MKSIEIQNQQINLKTNEIRDVSLWFMLLLCKVSNAEQEFVVFLLFKWSVNFHILKSFVNSYKST